MKIEIITGASDGPVAEFFSSSNTPETDAVVRKAATANHPPTRLAATLTVKCEKLERERNEARELAQQMSESNQVLMADVRFYRNAWEQLKDSAK